MKSILTILLLLVVVNVLGQKADGLSKQTRTIKKLSEQLSFKATDRPLIKINDTIYHGRLDDLPQDNIESIDVIRADNATKVFGDVAKNGVVLIITKNALSPDQPIIPIGDDYTKVVVDDKAYDKSLGQIDENNIFRADSMRVDTTGKFGSHPGDQVFIITKKAAIKAYQDNLSNFCTAYRAYLQNHKGNDRQVVYVVNGVPVEENVKLQQLYNVNTTNIKSVSMLNKPNEYLHPVVAIVLNKKN